MPSLVFAPKLLQDSLLFIFLPMFYRTETHLVGPIGNNEFAYEKRGKIELNPKLLVPSLINGSLSDVILGDTTCFVEWNDKKSELKYNTWLKHLVQRESDQTYFFVMDNHNHAFYARWKAIAQQQVQKGAYLIHLDQHSDLVEPTYYPAHDNMDSEEYVANYTNNVLQIATFIQPALSVGMITEQQQIRSEWWLLHYEFPVTASDIILDIDLDFWAPEMCIEHYKKTIQKAQSLIKYPQTKLVTIATSPHFIEQKKALDVLHDLLQ